MFLTEIQQQRLVKTVEDHRRRLRQCRESRAAAISQYVGPNYAGRDSLEQGKRYDRQPLPLVELYVTTYAFLLAAKPPRITASSDDQSMTGAAYALQLATNKALAELETDTVLQELSRAGLFGLATSCTGICESDENFYRMIGRPYVSNVDFDDIVYDTAAKAWGECQFFGHRYQLPYDAVMSPESVFDERAKSLMRKREEGPTDAYGEEPLSNMGAGDQRQPELFEDVVELWNLWLPRHRMIVTMPADGRNIVLREVEWDGPRDGPYDRLSFSDVPDMLLPLPPVNAILDLHELLNHLYIKSGRQALRQKSILPVPHGGEEDAKRINETPDGSAVGISKAAPGEVSYGGPDSKSLAMTADGMNKFNVVSGNINSLAGLSPMADTATAEGQILQQANARLAFMRDRVNRVAERIAKKVAFYMWRDPFVSMRVPLPLPGGQMASFIWDARAKAGDISQYKINLVQYSMQPKNPLAKLKAMMDILQGIVAPYQQIAMQQGLIPNLPALVRRAAELSDVEDELQHAFVNVPPPPMGQPQMPGMQAPSQPAQTKRTYERINRSSATQRGQDMALAQMLMGQGEDQDIQPAQMAQAMGAY